MPARPAPPEGLVLTRHHDLPSPPFASLWQVDEVRASIEDTPCGYLRISFIPASRFDPLSRDICNYLLARNRLSTYAAARQAARIDRLEHEELATFVRQARQALDGRSEALATDWSALPREALLGEVAALRPRLQRRFGRERDAFARFHVDKPMVDHVLVPEPFRRRGIGRALYREAAQWMSQRGLALHGSPTQTPPVRQLWQALVQAGEAIDQATPESRGTHRQVLRPPGV